MLQLQSQFHSFNQLQLSEFGLNPRDWLLVDPENRRETELKLLHRDDDEIQLKVRVLKGGEIEQVELILLDQ